MIRWPMDPPDIVSMSQLLSQMQISLLVDLIRYFLCKMCFLDYLLIYPLVLDSLATSFGSCYVSCYFNYSYVGFKS
jgi:hypothetical protein